MAPAGGQRTSRSAEIRTKVASSSISAHSEEEERQTIELCSERCDEQRGATFQTGLVPSPRVAPW